MSDYDLLLYHTYRGEIPVIGQARAHLRDALEGHPLADGAVQVMSELAANAILHSASGLPGGTWHLIVRDVEVADRHGLRLEVVDQGGGPWRRRSQDGNGLGMRIVRALCLSVRVSRLPGVPGRRVSAVMTPWT